MLVLMVSVRTGGRSLRPFVRSWYCVCLLCCVLVSFCGTIPSSKIALSVEFAFFGGVGEVPGFCFGGGGGSSLCRAFLDGSVLCKFLLSGLASLSVVPSFTSTSSMVIGTAGLCLSSDVCVSRESALSSAVSVALLLSWVRFLWFCRLFLWHLAKEGVSVRFGLPLSRDFFYNGAAGVLAHRRVLEVHLTPLFPKQGRPATFPSRVTLWVPTAERLVASR